MFRASPRHLTLALALALPACEDPHVDGRAPVIDDVRPAAAAPGAVITVVGRRFGLRGERDRVFVGGLDTPVESWTDTAVLVRLPMRAAGLTELVIRAGPWVSPPHPFEVLAPGPDDGVGDIIP